MTKLAWAYVKTEDGIRLYAPLDKADEDLVKDRPIVISETVGEKAGITELQRRAMHLYFRLLSEALNAAGLDMKATMEILSTQATIPWSENAVKERLWRPVQKNTYSKKSTTKLNTDEVTVVYEALNEVTSSKLGVGVEFPDKYSLFYEQMGRKKVKVL